MTPLVHTTIPVLLACCLLPWAGAPLLVGEDAAPATLSPTWIPGRWDWNGTQYIWKPGRWDNTPESPAAASAPPSPPPPPPPPASPAAAQANLVPSPPQPSGPNQQWIPSHWDQGPSGWIYIVGHYESPPQSPPAPAPAPAVVVQAQPQPVLIVQGQPPPDRIEVVGTPPTPDHVWLRGYWSIQAGAWLWVSGHWEMRHHHGAEWEPGRWLPTPRGYEWHEGHWR